MNERASYREFVLLHMDPVKVGVCVRRSIQSGKEEAETLTLRFWAHSIMQGPPDWLNMMGGLMSDAAVCSKVRPTGWLGIDVSAIICNKAKMLYVLDTMKSNNQNAFELHKDVINDDILPVMAGALCILQCKAHFWPLWYS